MDRETPGRAILTSAWAATVVFAAVALPDAAGVDAFDAAAVLVGLALFVAGLAVWAIAFALAVVRTARGDDVRVASLFLLDGPVPRTVRLSLFGTLALTLVVTAATASANPFGILVPMLPVGLVGLWGAWHGSYPPRAPAGQGGGDIRRRDRG